MAATSGSQPGQTNPLEGYGSTNVWGFSRAIDLQEREAPFGDKDVSTVIDTVGQSKISESLDDTMTFLILGASDARHIVKTVARAWRHSPKTLHFYVLEPQASLLARQLMLLNILWNPKLDMGMEEKAELFLEVYGNLLVRDKTAQFINTQASKLIRCVTDGEGPLAKLFDFRHLKFRERDDLEFVFKFWRDQKRGFDAAKLWEFRSQRYLGRRFDARENVADWDYHMKILEADKTLLSIIHKKEYIRWRLHGLAFEIRDAAHHIPNRTLATADVLKQDGVGTVKWGYFSDITLGPFVSYGLDTEAKDMLKTQNDKHTKASQDISMHNLSSFIYEMTHSQVLQETESLKITEEEEVIEPRDPLANVKVFFLPCDPAYTFVKKKAQFTGFFDRVFIGNSLAHRIPDAEALIKPDGLLIAENIKYMTDLSKHQINEFAKKELEKAHAAHLVLQNTKNSMASDVLTFVRAEASGSAR